MRIALLSAALVATSLISAPLAARDRGLVIDVKPRSWLDAGNVARAGQGRDYVTNTQAFGGAPMHGISSRSESNLPTRGLSGSGFAFEFLGANAVR
ncbi:MAG TPA: hypothetical protein PLQ11_00020 [Beijerinckiaceae bacterium]|nr:hypothetical protein [Beijerinckiaceae bacterium]